MVLVVVGIKSDPVPVSINYSYDFAIWDYGTGRAIQYGTAPEDTCLTCSDCLMLTLYSFNKQINTL